VTKLERGGARLDAAFLALPLESRRALAVAVYRVWPTFVRYQKELEGLMSAEVLESVWDLATGFGFRMVKGKEALKAAGGETLAGMPNIRAFWFAVVTACLGPEQTQLAPPAQAQLEAPKHD
jgi:hypothetical protein